VRIAALVLGLFLAIIIFFQSILASFAGSLEGAFGEPEQAEELSAAAGGGIIVALLIVMASSLALKFPRASTVLFCLGAIIAIPTGATSEYKDLAFWGVLLFIPATLSFFSQPFNRRWPLNAFQRNGPRMLGSTSTRDFQQNDGYCNRCGNKVRESWGFCRGCGNQLIIQ